MSGRGSSFLRRDWLPVAPGHQLHLAQYGDPEGIPLLYLHGGPGAGCSEEELRLFDTSAFHVLLLDQRGAGLSVPFGRLEGNDLQGLIDDLEYVREWLNLPWLCLAGGSFGATLGLIYSGLYPERVRAQVYWGLFNPDGLGRDWLYGNSGAAAAFPSEYAAFSQGLIPRPDTDSLLDDFYQRFAAPGPELRQLNVSRWLCWEQALAFPGGQRGPIDTEVADSLARIELHFARHNYFDAANLLQQALPQIRATSWIVQGELDWVCPEQLLSPILDGLTKAAVQYLRVSGGYHSLADFRMFTAVHKAIAEMATSTKHRP
jgi:proline iminopeptidase